MIQDNIKSCHVKRMIFLMKRYSYTTSDKVKELRGEKDVKLKEICKRSCLKGTQIYLNIKVLSMKMPGLSNLCNLLA